MSEEFSDNTIVSLDQEYNPSGRAEAILDHILQNDFNADGELKPEEQRITVAEAIKARPVLDFDTGRSRARVLFVTTDENVLLPDSSIRNYYLELARQFDEVHVFCLVSRTGEETLERADENIWFYQIRDKNWWRMPWVAKNSAKEALVWNGIVRPDVIVGVDPFEAGLAAYLIAKEFQRPIQLHIKTDFLKEEYLKENDDNSWRLRISKYLLKRVKSVRTSTRILEQAIEKKYPKLYDVSTLPRFYNFTGLLNANPIFDLHEKYPYFVFIMITFGPLTADSYLHDVFTAIHRMLRNQRIGLVVVGEGPAKNLFEEKVRLLGIEKNVVFQKEPDDLASYLKTSDLTVEMSTEEDGEVRILQAAAAGLPAVMVATDLRNDLFTDGQSGFICQPGDLPCIQQKISKFINSASMRKQFSENATDIARERLQEDPEAPYQATALTIESVLISSAEK